MTPLSEKELHAALENLPHWAVEDDFLVSAFTFDDFAAAVTFVNAVASIAEDHQHHPNILIEYDTVTIEMNTHDADDRITDKDISLAHAIEDIDTNFGVHPDYL